jgi:hypothetical protein
MVCKSVSKLARGTTYRHDEEVVAVEVNKNYKILVVLCSTRQAKSYSSIVLVNFYKD